MLNPEDRWREGKGLKAGSTGRKWKTVVIREQVAGDGSGDGGGGAHLGGKIGKAVGLVDVGESSALRGSRRTKGGHGNGTMIPKSVARLGGGMNTVPRVPDGGEPRLGRWK